MDALCRDVPGMLLEHLPEPVLPLAYEAAPLGRLMRDQADYKQHMHIMGPLLMEKKDWIIQSHTEGMLMKRAMLRQATQSLEDYITWRLARLLAVQASFTALRDTIGNEYLLQSRLLERHFLALSQPPYKEILGWDSHHVKACASMVQLPDVMWPLMLLADAVAERATEGIVFSNYEKKVWSFNPDLWCKSNTIGPYKPDPFMARSERHMDRIYNLGSAPAWLLDHFSPHSWPYTYLCHVASLLAQQQWQQHHALSIVPIDFILVPNLDQPHVGLLLVDYAQATIYQQWTDVLNPIAQRNSEGMCSDILLARWLADWLVRFLGCHDDDDDAIIDKILEKCQWALDALAVLFSTDNIGSPWLTTYRSSDDGLATSHYGMPVVQQDKDASSIPRFPWRTYEEKPERIPLLCLISNGFVAEGFCCDDYKHQVHQEHNRRLRLAHALKQGRLKRTHRNSKNAKQKNKKKKKKKNSPEKEKEKEKKKTEKMLEALLKPRLAILLALLAPTNFEDQFNPLTHKMLLRHSIVKFTEARRANTPPALRDVLGPAREQGRLCSYYEVKRYLAMLLLVDFQEHHQNGRVNPWLPHADFTLSDMIGVVDGILKKAMAQQEAGGLVCYPVQQLVEEDPITFGTLVDDAIEEGTLSSKLAFTNVHGCAPLPFYAAMLQHQGPSK